MILPYGDPACTEVEDHQGLAEASYYTARSALAHGDLRRGVGGGMTGLILGVDPGRTGALAWVDVDGALVDVVDMPDLTGSALGACLADLILENRPTVAVVEKVGAMPRQGLSSTWRFAEGYGVHLGALGALGVPVVHVTPAQWKRAARLSSDKTASRQRAIELWPERSELFARVKDDGRAEAALIARHHLTLKRTPQ